MTEREQFADWWERRGPEAVRMSWTEDACWFAWQASRRAALEEAAKVCDALAEQQVEDMQLFEDERHGVYAKKYRKAAAEIRHLSTGDTNNG